MKKLAKILIAATLFMMPLASCSSEDDESDDWVYEIAIGRETSVDYPYSAPVTIGGLNAIAYFRNENEVVLKEDLKNNKLKVLGNYEYKRDKMLKMRTGDNWETVLVSIKIKDDDWNGQWGRLIFKRYDSISYANAQDPTTYRIYDADRQDIAAFLSIPYPKPIVEVEAP